MLRFVSTKAFHMHVRMLYWLVNGLNVANLPAFWLYRLSQSKSRFLFFAGLCGYSIVAMRGICKSGLQTLWICLPHRDNPCACKIFIFYRTSRRISTWVKPFWGKGPRQASCWKHRADNGHSTGLGKIWLWGGETLVVTTPAVAKREIAGFAFEQIFFHDNEL
jgi:hypothetical protein